MSHPLLSAPSHLSACHLSCPNPFSGRAIRHIGDYATIVLADARFAKPSVGRRLPKWIGGQLKVSHSFGEALGSVRAFFAARAGLQATEEARRRLRHDAGEVVN